MVRAKTMPTGPVLKTLFVKVDTSSWPHTKPPPMALAALNGHLPTTINVLDVLKEVAVLTAPPTGYGFTTAETWAWLRYLPAIDPGPELRLRTEWSELDPHQKTILSDDWGVGLPIHLLRKPLQIQTIASTHYVLNRLAPKFPTIQAHLQKTGKRGPAKSPDFLAIDSTGKIHVIECKGTQSDIATLCDQLAKGVMQKMNIVFSKIPEGERLVVGLFIPQFSSIEPPLAMVRDPREGQPLVIQAEFGMVLEEVVRGELASTLHAVGLPTLGNIVATNQRQTARDNPAVQHEIATLELHTTGGPARHVRIEEFAWSLETDGNRESRYIAVEVGITSEMLNGVMDPDADLVSLFRLRDGHRTQSESDNLISESPSGFYFSARVERHRQPPRQFWG